MNLKFCETQVQVGKLIQGLKLFVLAVLIRVEHMIDSCCFCYLMPKWSSLKVASWQHVFNCLNALKYIETLQSHPVHNCWRHSVNGEMEIRWGGLKREEEEDFPAKVCINIMRDVWAIIT